MNTAKYWAMSIVCLSEKKNWISRSFLFLLFKIRFPDYTDNISSYIRTEVIDKLVVYSAKEGGTLMAELM